MVYLELKMEQPQPITALNTTAAVLPWFDPLHYIV